LRALHIPGSLHVNQIDQARQLLDRDDEIIVYCSDPTCAASHLAYDLLTNEGYRNVRRYVGGLADWQAAGYSLEGEMAQ
jgi:rhodanese-related sulfurtransferase